MLLPTWACENFVSMMSCALIDSGRFVNEMSFVRTPPRSVLDTKIIATKSAPQSPITRQG